MPNHSLAALTPLGNVEPQSVKIGTVTIAEVVGFSIASIARRLGKKTAFDKASKKAFGIPLPTPGHAELSDSKTLIWTGLEQWLFEAPSETHEDIVQMLKPEFKESGSITEQSGGWCRFDLDGDDCVELLQRLSALDSESMTKGDASRTIIEHIGVFIVCREHGKCFSIYGPRSSAESLHHSLSNAALSIA